MLNASFKSKNKIERQISNLAYSEFVIRGRKCHSIEGFYQGIKRSGDEMQDHIFQTFGLNAKKMSKPTKHVYFDGETLKAGSEEHLALVFEAQLCKYTQCEKSRKALVDTGTSKITHHVGRDSLLYPAKTYCKQLTTIRNLIAKGEL